jgi:signal transduction histidine kinase
MAALAHESRNLLQRGWACLDRLSWRLKGGDRDALELLAGAQRTQRELTHLFEDVRAWAGPLRIERAPCDLGEVWRDAWQQVRAVCPDRQAELSEHTDGVDLRCQADRFRLVQVFRNLLENSVLACPGAVRVEVFCDEVELDGQGPGLRLAFRDNGPGFDPEQRSRLFEPFYTTRPHGSGLSMTIARRIVEAHGGQIAVGAYGPPGAEVILTLPRAGS